MEIGELAKDLLNDIYFETLRFRLLNGKCAPQVETMLFYFAYGKPMERVKLEGDPRLSVEQFRLLAGLYDDDDPDPPPKPKSPKPALVQATKKAAKPKRSAKLRH